MGLMLCHLSVTEHPVHRYWLEEANWLRWCCKLGDLKPASFIVTWLSQNEVVRGRTSVATINKGKKYNLADRAANGVCACNGFTEERDTITVDTRRGGGVAFVPGIRLWIPPRQMLLDDWWHNRDVKFRMVSDPLEQRDGNREEPVMS